MSDAPVIEAMWSPWWKPGSEHLRLAVGAGGILADGVIVGLEGDAPFRLRYRVRCDAAWRVRELAIEPLDGSAPVELRAGGEGDWTGATGEPLPALDGCVDVDISATPFTNTLPIRRLGLGIGEASEIRVAYVEVPEMSVSASDQRYTRLAERTYRFESLDVDFLAELPVDEEGLVLDYPGLFKRTYRVV